MHHMKRSLTAIALAIFLLYNITVAQHCRDCRYLSPQFDSVTVETVKFGEGPRANGNIQELYMDVYQPYGDSATNRAVAVFAFGGAFVTGSRDDWYVVLACEELAKAGYVVASIDYRIYDDAGELATEVASGLISTGVPYHMRIFFRPMQDMRAAVQYLKAHYAEMGNTWRIDTSRILIGGASSGAITSMMVAYCDKETEIAELGAGSTAPLNALGGFYSTTGLYPNYCWKALATFNVAGALLSPNWLEPGDIPVISAHGDADQVVPYKEGAFAGLTLGFFNMYGSYIVDSAARANGVCSYLFNMAGQDHPNTGMGIEYIKSVVYRLMLQMHAVLNDRSFCCDLEANVNPYDTLFYEAGTTACLAACANNHHGAAELHWCGINCLPFETDSSVISTAPDTNQRYIVAMVTEGGCQDAVLIMVKEGTPLTCNLPAECEVSPVSSYNSMTPLINVYPQPAPGDLIVQAVLPSAKGDIASINLFDLSGKRVFSRNVPAATSLYERIDVRKLPEGCYVLQLLSGEHRAHRKVVVGN